MRADLMVIGVSVLVFGGVALGQVPAEPRVTVPEFGNKDCPIMGKPASSALFIDGPKGRIYVCCAPCFRKIRQDPDGAHRAAYPVIKKAGNTTCPVSGKPVEKDGPSVVLQGVEVGLCCTVCQKAAPEKAQVILALATDSALTDIGNTLCPIKGTPVDPNIYCVIDQSLVRLSSAECLESAKKDPNGTLEKARRQAAEAKKNQKSTPESMPGHTEKGRGDRD